MSTEYFCVCHDCRVYAELNKLVLPGGPAEMPSFNDFVAEELSCPHYSRSHRLYNFVKLAYFVVSHPGHRLEIMDDNRFCELDLRQFRPYEHSREWFESRVPEETMNKLHASGWRAFGEP